MLSYHGIARDPILVVLPAIVGISRSYPSNFLGVIDTGKHSPNQGRSTTSYESLLLAKTTLEIYLFVYASRSPLCLHRLSHAEMSRDSRSHPQVFQ